MLSALLTDAINKMPTIASTLPNTDVLLGTLSLFVYSEFGSNNVIQDGPSKFASRDIQLHY